MKRFSSFNGRFSFLAVFFLLVIITSCSDDTAESPGIDIVPIEVVPPNAEYDCANIVLVHTPGNEMMNSYGRTKKFDVDGMREEHLQYINSLKENGVQVFELTDVLERMSMNDLRNVAKMMFARDLGALDKKALIQYMIETPPLKGLYYTRDQSISTPRGQVICKMVLSHRIYEPYLIQLCYKYLGNNVIYTIHGEDSRMEGGDYLPFGTLSFIGEGLRTNRSAIVELMNADVVGHDTIVVVKDALRNSAQMHLDTYFNIIDKDLVALSAPRLDARTGESNYLSIDIYARKPGTLNYQLIEIDQSLVSFLQKRGVTIIPVANADQERFACNFLCIAPRHIIARQGLSADFVDKMESQHVRVEWVKLDELVEGTGAAHCMTQVISRLP